MAYNYELVIDVLNGCKWNCLGCTVDKNSKNIFSGLEMDRLRDLMLFEKKAGSNLEHFEIGPVDFMSCSNLREVFAMPAVIDLVREFEFVFLTSTFLSREDILKKADFIAESLRGKKVYLFIPFELRRVREKRVRELLFSNLELFRSLVEGKLEVSKVYINALDIPWFSALNYAEKLETAKLLYEQAGIKINFNYRLTSEESPQHYSYVSSGEFLPALLKEVGELDALYEDLNVPDYALDNKPRRGLLFKDDRLYWMPYLGKFTASVEPNFRVENNIGELADCIDLYEIGLKSSQLAYLDKTASCAECDLLEVCLSRGIHEAMKVYKHVYCVQPEPRRLQLKRMGAKR